MTDTGLPQPRHVLREALFRSLGEDTHRYWGMIDLIHDHAREVTARVLGQQARYLHAHPEASAQELIDVVGEDGYLKPERDPLTAALKQIAEERSGGEWPPAV